MGLRHNDWHLRHKPDEKLQDRNFPIGYVGFQVKPMLSICPGFRALAKFKPSNIIPELTQPLVYKSVNSHIHRNTLKLFLYNKSMKNVFFTKESVKTGLVVIYLKIIGGISDTSEA